MRNKNQLGLDVTRARPYIYFMSNAAKIEAIHAAAHTLGVTVKAYNSKQAALGHAQTDAPDRVTVSAKSSDTLRLFRNAMNRSAAMAGSKITKTTASAGHWNMGTPCDVTYSRTITL